MSPPQTARTLVYVSAVPAHGTTVSVAAGHVLSEIRWVALGEAGVLP